MPDWKRSRGRPPKTWLKQITVDLDTTAADALQMATESIVLRGEQSQQSQGYTFNDDDDETVAQCNCI